MAVVATLTKGYDLDYIWKQDASLRLREGDRTVLVGYDQHGRITGGDPEHMMDAAAAAYVALAADGTDVLLRRPETPETRVG